MNPQINTTWRYIGCHGDRNVKHRVVEVTKNEVTTWSEPVLRGDIGGWSWHGPVEDFKGEFAPA